MKKLWSDVKSFVTILLTLAMVVLLIFSSVKHIELNDSILAIFSTAYGAVITYFFTRKEDK